MKSSPSGSVPYMQAPSPPVPKGRLRRACRALPGIFKGACFCAPVSGDRDGGCARIQRPQRYTICSVRTTSQGGPLGKGGVTTIEDWPSLNRTDHESTIIESSHWHILGVGIKGDIVWKLWGVATPEQNGAVANMSSLATVSCVSASVGPGTPMSS